MFFSITAKSMFFSITALAQAVHGPPPAPLVLEVAMAVIIAAALLALYVLRDSKRLSEDPPNNTHEQPDVDPSSVQTALPPHAIASSVAVSPPVLSSFEQAKVQLGELVFRPYRNDAGVNRGIAVQSVSAPPSFVWRCLNDFEAYPRMVDDVCAARVYERRGAHTKVAVSIGFGPVHLTTCLHHTFSPQWQQLTWSLDHCRPSSFKSNEGFWLVRPDPLDESRSIVYYSIAVELKGWVPGWVNGFVAKQGIPRAVSWIKKEAEARARAAACSKLAKPAAPVAPVALATPAHLSDDERCRGPLQSCGLCAVFAKCFSPPGAA